MPGRDFVFSFFFPNRSILTDLLQSAIIGQCQCLYDYFSLFESYNIHGTAHSNNIFYKI